MKLSKTKVKNYRIDDKKILSKAYCYKIIDGNTILGEVIVDTDLNIWLPYESECLFVDRYRIDRKEEIKHWKDGNVVGKYAITQRDGSGILPKQICFSFKDKNYVLNSVKSDAPFSVLKSSSWGNFKFELSCADGNATYVFQVEQSLFSAIAVQNPYTNREFEGTAESNGLAPLEMLVGLMMVEKALYRGEARNLTSIPG